MTRAVIPVQLFDQNRHTKVNDVVYRTEAEAIAACEDGIEEPPVNEDPTTTPKPADPTDPTPWTPPGTGGGDGDGDGNGDGDGDGDGGGSGGGDGDGDGSGGGDGDGDGNGSGSAPPPINTDPQPPVTNTPGGPLAPPMLPNPPPTLGDPSSCQTCVHDSQVISTGGEAIGDGVGERCLDGCYCEVDPNDPFWDTGTGLVEGIINWLGGLVEIGNKPDQNKARGGLVNCPDQGTVSCCCPEGYKAVPYDRDSKNCTNSCDVTKYYYCTCYDGFGTPCTPEDKQFCESSGGTYHSDPLNPNNDPENDNQNCGCEWGAWGTESETILKITADDQPINENEPGYDPQNPYCPQNADAICGTLSDGFVGGAYVSLIDPCKLDKGPDNFNPNNPSASMNLNYLP